MDIRQDPPPDRQRLVVVVEDNAAIRDLVLICLDGEGIPTAGFSDPAEALCASALDDAGLVLLDLTLPTMAGEEFVTALRRRAERIPVCIMTAAMWTDERARSIGADCVLRKPFEIDEMVRTVKQFVG